MYNKPAPFNIGSPEELARAVGYSKQALAKVMQNPGSGVDQTLAVLAGMYIDRMKTGGMGAQAPTTTVKDDVMAAQPGGLQQASIPPEMFNSEVGAVPQQAPVGMAAGGLVAFASGGQVSDQEADAYGDPDMPMMTRRAGVSMKYPDMSSEEVDNYLRAAEKARIAKENRIPTKGLPTPRAVTKYSKNLSGTPERGVGNTESRAALADRTMYNPRLGGDVYMPAKAGLEAITPGMVNANVDLPLPDKTVDANIDLPLPGQGAGSNLPPMSSGVGGGASAGMSYKGKGAPVDLNTDLGKEIKNLGENYDKYYPKTDEEKKNAEYYSDEQVAQREKDQKHQDVWQSLMELGFGAAASNSPYWTQAWGESGKQMAPHVAAMMKARKDEKDAVQKARMAMAQADRARNDDEYKMAVQNVRAAQELQVQAQMKQEEIFAQFAMNNARINAPKESDDLIRIWAADLIRQNPSMSETEAKAQAADKYWNYRSGQTKAENTAFRTSYDKFMSQLIKNKDMDKGYRQALKKGPAQAQKYLQDQATALARAEVSATDTTASDGATGFRYLGKE